MSSRRHGILRSYHQLGIKVHITVFAESNNDLGLNQ